MARDQSRFFAGGDFPVLPEDLLNNNVLVDEFYLTNIEQGIAMVFLCVQICLSCKLCIIL